MIHIGGLTFSNDNDSDKTLRIPNLVASKRFGDAVLKTEEQHRDSFYYALLGNSHPSLRKIGIETQVTNPSQRKGRIDMLIISPTLNRVLVLEWKVVQLHFLKFNNIPPMTVEGNVLLPRGKNKLDAL
ncbi:hypothetical protein BGX27_005792 [Mortierella sp. AM989]|nr:hypothetical protein BGX27_005792 [Mortierella sp. AM989]